MSQAPSHRESDETYHGVVAVLNEGWRVIVCKDGVQWILQFARKRQGGVEWASRRYHRAREHLIRSTRKLAGACDAAAITILHGLPERIAS